MSKKYNIGKIATGIAAVGVLSFLGGRYSKNTPHMPEPSAPVYAEDPFQGPAYNESVLRAETERLLDPSAVENRLALRGVADSDAMQDIVSHLYRVIPDAGDQLDSLTRLLANNKKAWQGIGVYTLPSSPFREGDLDIDTGLKEWYGSPKQRELWVTDYDIIQAEQNPGTVSAEHLKELLDRRRSLRQTIFGKEEPLLNESDLQGMLDEQMRDGIYDDK